MEAEARGCVYCNWMNLFFHFLPILLSYSSDRDLKRAVMIYQWFPKINATIAPMKTLKLGWIFSSLCILSMIQRLSSTILTCRESSRPCQKIHESYVRYVPVGCQHAEFLECRLWRLVGGKDDGPPTHESDWCKRRSSCSPISISIREWWGPR